MVPQGSTPLYFLDFHGCPDLPKLRTVLFPWLPWFPWSPKAPNPYVSSVSLVSLVCGSRKLVACSSLLERPGKPGKPGKSNTLELLETRDTRETREIEGFGALGDQGDQGNQGHIRVWSFGRPGKPKKSISSSRLRLPYTYQCCETASSIVSSLVWRRGVARAHFFPSFLASSQAPSVDRLHGEPIRS